MRRLRIAGVPAGLWAFRLVFAVAKALKLVLLRARAVGGSIAAQTRKGSSMGLNGAARTTPGARSRMLEASKRLGPARAWDMHLSSLHPTKGGMSLLSWSIWGQSRSTLPSLLATRRSSS
jgi:hypothetical protein